jgi:hypothetical protein
MRIMPSIPPYSRRETYAPNNETGKNESKLSFESSIKCTHVCNLFDFYDNWKTKRTEKGGRRGEEGS